MSKDTNRSTDCIEQSVEARLESSIDGLLSLCRESGHVGLVVIAKKPGESDEKKVLAKCEFAEGCEGVELLCHGAAQLIQALQDAVLEQTGENIGIVVPSVEVANNG